MYLLAGLPADWMGITSVILSSLELGSAGQGSGPLVGQYKEACTAIIYAALYLFFWIYGGLCFKMLSDCISISIKLNAENCFNGGTEDIMGERQVSTYKSGNCTYNCNFAFLYAHIVMKFSVV